MHATNTHVDLIDSGSEDASSMEELTEVQVNASSPAPLDYAYVHVGVYVLVTAPCMRCFL